jgi:hypothetical protein
MSVLTNFLQGKPAILGSWPGNIYQAYLKKLKNNPVFPKPRRLWQNLEKVLPKEEAFVIAISLDEEMEAILNLIRHYWQFVGLVMRLLKEEQREREDFGGV